LACGREFDAGVARWRCECGSVLTTEFGPPKLRLRANRADDPSWWRYRELLPLFPDEHPVTLGDPISPLIALERTGPRVLAKLDFLSPTGSFKDRNASLIATRLAFWGVRLCAVDSSGNAGIACAAYCARAGIKCTVYVPDYTSAGKRRLIAAYGARVELVEGSRQEATRAALARSEQTFYGGQTHSPFFEIGGMLWAYEVFDVLGRLPDAIVLPVGSGSLLLGAARGFTHLADGKPSATVPRLYAIQAANCAPLADAFERRLGDIDATRGWARTVAEGIATESPLRSKRLLEAVRKSGGSFIAVGDEAIEQAQEQLAHRGLCVEPTAGAALAGFRVLQAMSAFAPEETVIVSLTGSGQKYVASTK
jgi:threonine synthase